jgi:hypothetical protein
MKSRERRIPRLLAVPAIAVAVTVGLTVPADAATPRGSADHHAVTGTDRSHSNALIRLVDGDRTTFGGISFDEKTATATVRYDDSASERVAMTRLGRLADTRAGGWRVVLQKVPHSLAELDTVRQRVATDAEWRAVAGDVISKWYINVRTNRVTVGVTELTPQVRETAEKLFGDLVTLQVAPRQHRQSRVDDFEPWTAGIRIFFNPGGGCTSGFIIRTVSAPIQRRMVSAGHCGNLGATITNNGDLVGSVVDQQLAQNGLDYAHIAGRAYEAWMYTGGPDSNVGFPIKGSILSGVGLGVCTNGATTGENCAGQVTAIDICVTFDDGITTCFLDEAQSTNGSALSNPGDSGGPVIAFDAAGLKVVGVIIGGSTTTFFHSYHYLVPGGWTVDTT